MRNEPGIFTVYPHLEPLSELPTTVLAWNLHNKISFCSDIHLLWVMPKDWTDASDEAGLFRKKNSFPTEVAFSSGYSPSFREFPELKTLKSNQLVCAKMLLLFLRRLSQPKQCLILRPRILLTSPLHALQVTISAPELLNYSYLLSD